MSPLERRYRRLLRLLPRQHRAARGEELLGLLLDLDDGRTRPSARQALGLIGLAIRLRLAGRPAAGTVLFSAFLVTFGTAPIASRFVGYAYAGTSRASLPYVAVITVIVLTSALAQLGVVVAWVLGAARAALALQFTVLLADFGAPILLAMHIRSDLTIALLLIKMEVTTLPGPLQLVVLCLLAVAVRRRWSTPRPPLLWLAAVAQLLIAWALIDLATRNRHLPTAYTGWILAAATAAIAVLLARPRSWLVFGASVLIGAGIGALLPLALPYPHYLNVSIRGLSDTSLDWLAVVILGTAFIVAGDWFLGHQLPDRSAAGPHKVSK